MTTKVSIFFFRFRQGTSTAPQSLNVFQVEHSATPLSVLTREQPAAQPRVHVHDVSHRVQDTVEPRVLSVRPVLLQDDWLVV